MPGLSFSSFGKKAYRNNSSVVDKRRELTIPVSVHHWTPKVRTGDHIRTLHGRASERGEHNRSNGSAVVCSRSNGEGLSKTVRSQTCRYRAIRELQPRLHLNQNKVNK